VESIHAGQGGSDVDPRAQRGIHCRAKVEAVLTLLRFVG
jgi:hypothetical protein